MADETVHGIVLRYANFSESSRMLTILTPGEGLISAAAKGARRLKSPLRTASELFSFAFFTIHRGRGANRTVTGAELIDSFYDLREDLDRLSAATGMAELVLALAPEGEPQPELFTLLVRALSALCHDREDPFKTGIHFQLRAMALAGYAPEFKSCALCGKIPEKMYFSPEDGGVLCEECSAGTGLAPVNPGAVRMLANLSAFDAERLHVLSIGFRQEEEVADLWQRYMSVHLERHFRSPEFSKRAERFSLAFDIKNGADDL